MIVFYWKAVCMVPMRCLIFTRLTITWDLNINYVSKTHIDFYHKLRNITIMYDLIVRNLGNIVTIFVRTLILGVPFFNNIPYINDWIPSKFQSAKTNFNEHLYNVTERIGIIFSFERKLFEWLLLILIGKKIGLLAFI